MNKFGGIYLGQVSNTLRSRWKGWHGRTTRSSHGVVSKRGRFRNNSMEVTWPNRDRWGWGTWGSVGGCGGGTKWWRRGDVVSGGRGTHPGMSVTPRFRWMEGAPYCLIQPSNMETRRLDLEQPKKHDDGARHDDYARPTFYLSKSSY